MTARDTAIVAFFFVLITTICIGVFGLAIRNFFKEKAVQGWAALIEGILIATIFAWAVASGHFPH